jgi:hypothetical protein
MKKIIKYKYIKKNFLRVSVSAFFIIALILTFQAGSLVNQFGDVRMAVSEFGQDLNEMREYLLLPKRDYSFFDVGSEFSPDDQYFINQGVEKFATELGENYLLEKNRKTSYQSILDLKNDTGFYNELKNIKLLPARYLDDKKETAILKFYQGNNAIAQLILDKNNGEFIIQSIIGSYGLIPNNEKSLKDLVLNYLTENKDIIINMKSLIAEKKEVIQSIWDNESIKSVLTDKNLRPNLNPAEIEAGFEYVIQDADSIPVFSIVINRQNGYFILQGVEYKTVEDLLEPLLNELKSLEGKSVRMKAIQEKRENLEELFADLDFTESLNALSLKIGEPRDEGQRIYYDLVNTDDEYKLGSIIFEKETGDIMFLRTSDGVELDMDQIFASLKKNK